MIAHSLQLRSARSTDLDKLAASEATELGLALVAGQLAFDDRSRVAIVLIGDRAHRVDS
jgi:hypothetical protein